MQVVPLRIVENGGKIPLSVSEENIVAFTSEEIRVVEAVSPTAKIEENTDGALITIHDLHGTTTAQINNGDDYILTEQDKSEIAAIAAEKVTVPVQDVQVNGTSIVNDGVAEIPIANATNLGVVKVAEGTTSLGVWKNGDLLAIRPATNTGIKEPSQYDYRPIVPWQQDKSVFYGLAKAAGDTTQSVSANPVGQYTDDAKAAIQQMLDVPSTDDVPEVPVQDVQVNGVSVLSDGVANVPKAGASLGVVRINSERGINISDGLIFTNAASTDKIKAGTDRFAPIAPWKQHESSFYGLAKAAGDTTQSVSSNPVGTYTDEAKAAIQTMLDVPSTDDIPDVPVQDVQVNGASVLTDSVANIVVGNGIAITSGAISISPATDARIKKGIGDYNAIVPPKQHQSTFFGLSKAAGVDLANETVTVGTYPDTAKAAIRTMLGAGDVTDVQVNGTSVVTDGVANVPVATSGGYGVVKIDTGFGIASLNNNGTLMIMPSTSQLIKTGSNAYRPIVATRQHESTFYGLAKAAGDTTQSVSANPVGQYTDEAKSAIQSMLGIPSMDDIVQAVHDSYPAAEEASF